MPRDVPSPANTATTSGSPSAGEPTTGNLPAAPSPATTIGGSSPASATAEHVIDIAKSKLGAPYVYGASGPDSFDCSGFTSWVFGQVGISLPRTADEQWVILPKHLFEKDKGEPAVPVLVQIILSGDLERAVRLSAIHTIGQMGASGRSHLRRLQEALPQLADDGLHNALDLVIQRLR